MTEKREIFFAKLIALIIVLLLCFQLRANSAQNDIEKVTKLFIHYNKKLSREEVQTLSQIVFREGAKHSINPYIIAAIIVRESSVRSRAIDF